MNAVGLLFQQATQTSAFEEPRHQMNNNNVSYFQSKLNEHNASHILDSNKDSLDVEQEDLLKLTRAHLLDLVGTEELKVRDNEVVMEDDTIESLLSLINSKLHRPLGDMNDNDNFMRTEDVEQLISQLIEGHSALSPILVSPWVASQEGVIQKTNLTEEHLYKQFNNLFQRAEKLLDNLPNENTIMRVSPKILELLKELVSLERESGKQSNGLLSKDENSTREQRGWQQLINTFQKRNQLVTKHQYNRTAEVTSTDVEKWITKLFGEVEESEVVRHHAATNTMSMSRLEQFMIHINQTQQALSVDQQIIERIETIMAKSNFLARNNGVNQLSIALKPENLGDMTIRLVQINGEMIVKFIVTSATTKKMLESNIHQLKNMFSPQQVIIEKQDFDTLKFQEEQEEQLLDKQEQDDQEQENKDRKQEDNGEFEKQFHQMLNEKV